MRLCLSLPLWTRKSDKLLLWTKFSFNPTRTYGTHYDTLKVKRDADPKEIRRAYLEQSKKVHPDLNKSNPNSQKQFIELNEAYKILSNPSLRRMYDSQNRPQSEAYQSNTNYNAANNEFTGFSSATGPYKYRVRTKTKKSQNDRYEYKSTFSEDIDKTEQSVWMSRVVHVFYFVVLLYVMKIVIFLMELLARITNGIGDSIKKSTEEQKLRRSLLQHKRYKAAVEKQKMSEKK